MPTEGHSFMFGGSKKRCTLVEEKVIFFPREDASSPRQHILKEFCPCLHANNFDENNCPKEKKVLVKCSNKAFRKVNSDPNYVF